VPTPASFDYAILRVVPRVERQEFINAGVVAFCLEKRYLAARIHLDEARLRALWPEVDIDLAREHELRTLDLTSRPSRTAAIRLYESVGFERRDSVLMRLRSMESDG